MSQPRHISECITEWMTEYADIAQLKGHSMNLDPEPERATDLDAWRSVAQGDAEDRDADELRARLDAVVAAIESIHYPSTDHRDGFNPYCEGCYEAGGYDGAPSWPCHTALALIEFA